MLADHLEKLGVGIETMVPLCFEKSKWTVVAQIAVLKAGGACVSVDYSTPRDRLKTILGSTGANLAIATPSHARIFTGLINHTVVLSQRLLDELACDRLPGSLHKPRAHVKPDNAAFVVFTSGSTGVPKGIVTEHRAICTSAKHHGKAMNFTPASRVLQFAAYTFDVSISDTFVTLVHGGCVCIPSEEDRKENLAAFVNKTKVNSMCLTSTVADFLSPSEVPNVRSLTLGGEPLRKGSLLTWAESTSLGNVYGPAEASVWCIHRGSLKADADPMNIGSAVGCRAWIADAHDHQQLVPIGCIGELLLEGPILARGYLNDPIKTAAAFIKSPKWLLKYQPNSRLYKTGDLARLNSDGTISFAGRSDTQVKLHGQRVELGDIQYHVQKSLPGSCKVAVDVIHLNARKDILTAFISMERPDSSEIGELRDTPGKQWNGLTEQFRSKLASILPSYMIPTAFISLPQLPQTTSGKLDRKLLRQIGSEMSTRGLFPSSEPHHGNRRLLTRPERRLSNLWASVLDMDVSEIDVDSNFLKVGGDSLDAMRLVAAARQEGLNLGFVDIMRHPTLSAMATNIKILDNIKEIMIPPFSLLPEKLDITKVRAEASDLCQIPQSAIEDIYPCTPLQEGIIALSQKQPGSYIGRHALKLPPSVNLERFYATWEAVVEACEVLRTRIVHSSHGFLQVVMSRSENPPISNIVEEYFSPIPLGSPTMHSGVTTTPEGRFFTLTAHHVIYDGWSLAKVFEMVNCLYNDPTMVAKPTSFKRFIAHLRDVDANKSLEFWRTQLKDFATPAFPKLPSKDYSPHTDQFVVRQIPLSRDSCVTVNVMVRAAWAVLLARYQGVDDVVFGTTMAGRNASISGVENILGPTMTTVPIRVLIQGHQAVRALLDQLQEQSLEMLPFEHAGLQNIARISSECRIACDFQSLVVLHPGKEVAKEDHEFVTSGDQDVIAKSYALMLECTPSADGLRLRASFDSNVVAAKQMERILGQLDHLLHQISRADSESKVNDLKVISPEDIEEISNWNQERPPAYQACVHDVIKEQAARTPQSTAVCAWDGQLTYSQLDNLSSTLAHHLKSHGVGPEVFVPLCFEKSVWAIVAEIAVLKAGGACVSVDPSHPIQRLEHIFEDVKANIVVTTPLFAHLFEKQSREVVTVSEDLLSELIERPGYSCNLVRPNNAAFVVFTSGSTGVPKGICQDHAAYCTNLRLQGPIIGAGPGRRVLQFAAHTFDAFLSDIITTLAYGGCCCVPSEADRLNDLAGVINRMQVNQSLLTPSVIKHLSPDEVPTLQVLILSGEVLSTENLLVWADKVRLINLYGPAECTIWATYRDLVRPDSDPRNIGKGVGALIWITEPTNPHRLAPIGAVGEMLIDGEGLARGYLNAKEKTEQSFIAGPAWLSTFDSPVSRKLYRTGDLVSYNTDGSIHIVGRRDTQVKLRGQRVELSEVEHHLALHTPTAAQITVEVISPANSQMLAAFVCLKPGSIHERQSVSDQVKVLTDGLSAKLSQSVPAYMIPTAFIPMTEIPLTVHSKVDRAKLRLYGSNMSAEKLASCSTKHSTAKLDCTTSTEITLCNLWARVLDISPATIGANDNFIGLGGDSIRAMTLVTIARVSVISLFVADIFKSPILQDMAKKCRDIVPSPGVEYAGEGHLDRDIAPWSLMGKDKMRVFSEINDQVTLDSGVIEDVYPATPMQEALMVLTTKQPGTYTGRYVFELAPSIDIRGLQTAWNMAFKRHAILRSQILQLASYGTVQIVTKSEIDWRRGTTLETYLEQDDDMRFPFGQPLARFAVVDGEGARPSFFVLTLHHAVYDGWSLPALFQSVDLIYKGIPYTAPVGFNRFVKYCMSIDIALVEKYWRSELEGAKQASFPTLPSQTYQTTTYAYHSHKFTLQHNSQALATTANVIYASWALLMARYSDSNDIVFGAIVAGRNVSVPDIDRIAGPTINAVPVRVKISDAEAVTEFSRRLQRQFVNMIDFQHAGLQNISKLSPDSRAACNFQSMIAINPSKSTKRSPAWGHLMSDEGSANFYTYPLLLECDLDEEEIEIKVTYDEAIIDCRQVRRILLQLSHIVQQINRASQDRFVRNIDLTSAEERNELREMQRIPPKLEICVHSLVKQQVVQQPTTVAVESWDGSLTFAELDILSTKLACRLQRLGAHPDMIIPICFEKSMWAVVAMLAISKSGAAFVAFDPSQPFERLEMISKLVHARIILASETASEVCDKLTETVITVSKTAMQNGRYFASLQQLEPLATPSSMFYIVFTSGSTGKPKGVMIDHAAYASVVAKHGESMHIRRGTRVLQYSSYCFDASVLEIMSTLALGGRVCIPSDQERTDDIIGAMNRMQVHLAIMTPSVADFLLPDDVPSLETLVLGGESMKSAHIKVWSDKVQLVNAFGPSECSVVIVVNSDVTASTSPANVGHPVGVACWVVDAEDHNRLAPFGTLGELLVEGPTLARGYYEQPEKTDSVFIRDPAWALNSDESRRFYKTGDLVRWNSDFTLTFVGRKDTQVKIHGQRAELGEIESCLGCYGDVKHNVVMLPSSGPCIGKLAALISLHSTSSLGPLVKEGVHVIGSSSSALLMPKLSQLRSYLSARLPSYMVPQVWLVVEKMPLLSTGKIDRALLNRWLTSISQDYFQSFLDDIAEAPRRVAQNPVEERFLEVIADALGADASLLDMNRSFLALGGDSISAMRVMKIFKSKGIVITVLQILRSETLLQLCSPEDFSRVVPTNGASEAKLPWSRTNMDLQSKKLVGQSNSELSSNDLPLLSVTQASFESLALILAKHGLGSREKVEDIYACTPMQGKMLRSQLICPHFYQSRTLFEILPSEPQRTMTPELVRSAWEMVVSCHQILRTVFVKDTTTGEVSQMALRKARPEIVDIYSQPQDALRVLNEIPGLECQECVLPHRLAICRTSDARILCRFDINHALVDGPSLHKMLEDLASAMAGSRLSSGPDYSQFVSYVQKREIDAHLDYWNQYLARLTPCRFPTEPQPYEEYRSVSIQLLLKDEVKDFCRQHAITPSSLVRTVWGLVLRHFLGKDSVSFGYLVSARNLKLDELNQIVGPLLSVLPCQFDAKKSMPIRSILKDVQLDSVESLHHEGVSLPEVCMSLNVDEDSLFNTMINFRQFNYHAENQHDPPFALEDRGGADPMNVSVPQQAFAPIRSLHHLLRSLMYHLD